MKYFWLRRTFGFGLTFLLFSILGRANIIVNVPSVTPAGGGEFTWTYDAKLVEGFQIQPSPAPCAFAPPGANCDGLITIYDFSGYVEDSQFQPDGWTFIGAFLGETPVGITPGTIIAGVDDALIFNLSWLYSPGAGGPIITATSGGGNVDLGLFGANSVYAQSRPSEYSARSNTLSITNGRDINSAVTLVPQVPEPASLVLVGSGLLGLAFTVRRRRRG